MKIKTEKISNVTNLDTEEEREWKSSDDDGHWNECQSNCTECRVFDKTCRYWRHVQDDDDKDEKMELREKKKKEERRMHVRPENKAEVTNVITRDSWVTNSIDMREKERHEDRD